MKKQIPYSIGITASLALVMLSGCKFGGDPSSIKDLNQGIQLSTQFSRDPSKAQVLVYLANNPVATSSYLSERKKILETLAGAKSDPEIPAASIDRVSDGLHSDMDNFGDAVAIDMHGIKNSICSTKATVGSAAIVITNDNIVKNSASFCSPKSELTAIPAAEMKKLSDVYARIKSNPIYEHSPLSHYEMLEAALNVVHSMFPTTKFEYSIVLKSHGNESLSITPKVAYESRILNRGFIKDRFGRKRHSPDTVIGNGRRLDKDGLEKDGLDKNGLDKDGLDKDGLDKDGLDKDGLDKDGLDKNGLDKDGLDKDGLDKIGLEKDGLDKEGLDSAGLARGDSAEGAVAAGITKLQMMRSLLNQDRDLFFNIVFMESCRSELGSLMQDIAEVKTPTIGILYGSDNKGLGYNTIDWSSLERSGATSLRDWMKQELDKKAKKSQK